MSIANPRILAHRFLADMYADSYFPRHLVDKVKAILESVCARIEAEKPTDVEDLYRITHTATEEINALADDFADNDSEIETGAREAIGADFAFIAAAYGFDTADIEQLIAPRDW